MPKDQEQQQVGNLHTPKETVQPQVETLHTLKDQVQWPMGSYLILKVSLPQQMALKEPILWDEMEPLTI
ncbi:MULTISPECIES: hypothetical protein [Bacillus]|uniref:Uncharacterized protein n=1 Tax=Bacillus capparidis TaxID=1840411 RepID=A0ABS4D0U6_9BACI|nr:MULTISPECIES: hypothetical protein [Bacillus]MBP1083251.1 hypothetical protein [Bacillus capparidis]MED1097687.1 hypothetical protein [Bacillus capparidis]